MTAASESAQDALQQHAEQADQRDADQHAPFITDWAGSISPRERDAFYRALDAGETT